MNPEQQQGQGGQLPPHYSPQQPMQAPPPSSGGGGDYDFIMNPQKPSKKILPTGNSLVQRIAIVGGGLVILLIVGIVFMSILSSDGSEKTENLLTVAQEQTELIRIATEGSKNATGLPAQNLAQTVQASITSDNSALLAYMNTQGQKVSKEQLAAKQDKTTDTTLTNAKASNTYDLAFKDIMQSDLTAYLAAVQKAYKDNPGPKGQELLSKQFDGAELLLTLSKQ